MFLMSKKPTEKVKRPEVCPGKIYCLATTEVDGFLWAAYLDRTSTRMDDHLRWYYPEDNGTLFLAIEETDLRKYENVHYKVRQNFGNLRGFMFLTGDVRVWIPQDFWDRFEECDT
jgi:hypothetical protein